IDEGFEARELDAFQTHVGLSVAVSLRSDERNSPCLRSGSLSIVGGGHRARRLSRWPGGLAAGCAAYFTATGGYACKEPARLVLHCRFYGTAHQVTGTCGRHVDWSFIQAEVSRVHFLASLSKAWVV